MNLNKFLLVVVIAVTVALGYIHQQVEIVKVSYKINRHEQVLTQLVDQNKILRYNVSYLKAAPHLEKRLMARQVKLSMPQAQSVVQMEEVRPNPLYAGFSKTRDAFIGLFAFRVAAAK